MSGTLYTVVPIQTTGKIIRATAELAGVQYTVPQDYVHFESNKKPEFLSKFPHGKIPAWDGADGFKLFEGIPVARYLASLAPNGGLLGSTPTDAALVDQWTHLAETEVDNFTYLIRALCSGQIPYNKPTHTLFLERQTRSLSTLNAHLATRTFFVGERITLADLAVAGFVQRAVSLTLDPAARATIPHVIRHLETVVNQTKVKDAFGPIEYCEKAIAFTPPPKEKKEKPAAAPAAPKADKKKKEAEDDAEEPDVPPEPKAKNPLDDLPKPTMVLDDWKRAYSNKDTRGADGALEWLYANFDKEGYSLWRVDFKYNEELKATFMSSNQIGGFFNRLEASRKYLFGSVGVLGESNNSIITGALIIRGKEIEPVINVAPDWESYTYTPIDLADESQKKFFEGALAWDLEVDGKTWVDGKNFK